MKPKEPEEMKVDIDVANEAAVDAPVETSPIPVGIDWSKVPVDTYWFGKNMGRPPGPDEHRGWELELILTNKVSGMRDRMLARPMDTYTNAVASSQRLWEANIKKMGPGWSPYKISVLGG